MGPAFGAGSFAAARRGGFPSVAATTSTFVRPKSPKMPPLRTRFVWRMTASLPKSALTRAIASCIESATNRLTRMAFEAHHPYRFDLYVRGDFVVRDHRGPGKDPHDQPAQSGTDDRRAQDDSLPPDGGGALEGPRELIVDGLHPLGRKRYRKTPLRLDRRLGDLLLE